MKILFFLLFFFSALFGFEYWQYVDKQYKFTTEKELAQSYAIYILDHRGEGYCSSLSAS